MTTSLSNLMTMYQEVKLLNSEHDDDDDDDDDDDVWWVGKNEKVAVIRGTTILVYDWKNWWKSWRNLDRIATYLTKTWTRYLLNTGEVDSV